MFQFSNHPILLFLSLSLPILNVSALQREVCNRDLQAALKNGSLAPTSPIFFRDHGEPMSHPDNIGLTIEGCQTACGKGFDWYTDVGPRLVTWLVPVILVVGNLQYATLGKRNTLYAVLHLLGDPIDSTWSLLTRLEALNRCWDLAQKLSHTGGTNVVHIRDRAALLAAIHALEGPGTHPERRYVSVADVAGLNDGGRAALHHLVRATAHELSDSTPRELPRTWLAVLAYMHTVVSAFVDAIEGTSSSQPGGRIGLAMFMSWLLPVALLSNTVVTFNTRRTCLRILERFARESRRIQRTPKYLLSAHGAGGGGGGGGGGGSASWTAQGVSPEPAAWYPPVDAIHHPQPAPGVFPSSPAHEDSIPDVHDLQLFSQNRRSEAFGGRWTSHSSFHDAQPWSGSIESYHTPKTLFHVAPASPHAPNPYLTRETSRLSLFLLSLAPLLCSTTASFLIIYLTPTQGLTCRHFPLLGILGAWLLSALTTQALWTTGAARGKYHFAATLVKDALVAAPSLTMVFVTASGYFNSCRCWSSTFSRGAAGAVVLLDPTRLRLRNAKSWYPALVSVCLGVHGAWFALVLRASRRGRGVLRRGEREKTEEFWTLHRAGKTGGGHGAAVDGFGDGGAGLQDAAKGRTSAASALAPVARLKPLGRPPLRSSAYEMQSGSGGSVVPLMQEVENQGVMSPRREYMRY